MSDEIADFLCDVLEYFKRERMLERMPDERMAAIAAYLRDHQVAPWHETTRGVLARDVRARQ